MGILLGLGAAFLWGSGDLLINRLTQLVGTSRSLVLTQILSLACWAIVAAVGGFPAGPHTSQWEIAAICGVFHVAGMFLTYRAFEIGTMSLVSPIASSFAIVTAVLALCSGERPGAAAISGALLLVLGVAIVTRASSHGETTATLKGVPEALGSALAFGIMFWRIEPATHTLGMAWPLIVLKVMASSSALASVWMARKKATPLDLTPKSKMQVGLLALGVAVSDSMAWGCFILGTRASYTSVVTALASLFSAFTVILAAIFLGERLNRPQYLGIGAVFVGILLVSV